MTRGTRPLFAAAAIIASVIGSTLAGHAETAQEAAPDAPVIPTPTPAQQVWQDCEIGLLFCFDLPIAAGIYDPKNNTHRERVDPAKYNPVKLNTDQWLAVAKAARQITIWADAQRCPSLTAIMVFSALIVK